MNGQVALLTGSADHNQLEYILMKYDDVPFTKLHPVLAILSARSQKNAAKTWAIDGNFIWLPPRRHEFPQLFRDMKQRYLVVDYDPEIIEHLEVQGVRHAYGDATDSEF